MPTPCSITVAGKITYTFSGFNFLSSAASGGGNNALLTFSKVSAPNGVVFLANAGQTSGFTFSYNVAIAPAVPAFVAYGTPFIVSIATGSRSGNGSGAVQLVVSPAFCQAIVVSTPQANCTIAAGQPLTLSPGNIVTLSGNAGNVSIGAFSNLFDTTFTPLAIGLDIDGSNSYEALNDGLLVLRYMLGLRGTALVNGATQPGAKRTTAAQIEPYIQALLPTLPP